MKYLFTLLLLISPAIAQDPALIPVTLCYRGQTVIVPTSLATLLIPRGATAGECPAVYAIVSPVRIDGFAQAQVEILDSQIVGHYVFDVDVVAIGEDVLIPKSVSDGVTFEVQGGTGSLPRVESRVLGTIVAGPYFVVHQDQQVRFILSVYFHPDQAGFYRTTLFSLNYATTPGGPLITAAFDPEFTSQYLQLP